MTIAKPQPGDYAPFYQKYLDASSSVDNALDLLAQQGDVLAYMATWPEDQGRPSLCRAEVDASDR